MRDLHIPGRSPVHATNAMVATSHPGATLTALDILRSGGNAVDAAIAAAAMLGVVEPHSTGIGGDCFVLYAPGGGDKVIAVNGSGKAPAAADSGWFAEQGIESIGFQDAHAVTVPAAVAAWHMLSEDHGKLGLDRLLQPAIKCAEDGFVVHQVIADVWQREQAKLAADANCRAAYLPDGRPLQMGEIHRLPALGATLRRIAEQGRDGFYTGAVAEDMVGYLRGLGGLHTLDDFAAARADYVDSISTDYHGTMIHECPPNGQGILVLMMLNILSGFDLSKLDPNGVERLHLEAEVTRLAYRDRAALVADPALSDVPIEHLLSRQYADDQRALIRPDRRLDLLPPAGQAAHRDTVFLSVVDKDMNAVAFINSIFHSYGSGLVSPESGVLFHNRGSSFVLDPAHPNCIAPSKRPMHTIMPGMMMRGGRPIMPFGVMGGHYQPVGQLHFANNVLDYGMDVQAALDAPRAFAYDGVLSVERGVPEATRAGLAALGHDVAVAEGAFGGGQAIEIDWQRGVLTGSSDPRKDGCALGY